MMKTIAVTNKEEIDSAGKDIIAKSIQKILETKEYAVLAVPGGRSIQPIFDALHDDTSIPWEKVHIFLVDERLVALDENDSNGKLVKESFVDALVKKEALPAENFHPFIYNPDAADLGIAAYEEELKKYGGQFDIILLGTVEDGHIGALYPNHASIADEADFFITMQDSPKPPPGRMSSSKNLLLKASVSCILFVGEGKKDAYAAFKDENIQVQECPAKLVASIPESYVLTDLQ